MQLTTEKNYGEYEFYDSAADEVASEVYILMVGGESLESSE